MSEPDLPYYPGFKKAVLSHKMSSGEIIVEIDTHSQDRYQPLEILPDFLQNQEIRSEYDRPFEFEEIDRDQAIESICYGLSPKINYTSMGPPFEPAEAKKTAYEFLAFFDNPKCFRPTLEIFRKELPLDDFWAVGGALALDDTHVGILWVNDLYDYYE